MAVSSYSQLHSIVFTAELAAQQAAQAPLETIRRFGYCRFRAFPVIVRDAQRPRDRQLTKDDFQIFDRGKPQKISAFTIETRAPTRRTSAHTPPVNAASGVVTPPAIPDIDTTATAARYRSGYSAAWAYGLRAHAGRFFRHVIEEQTVQRGGRRIEAGIAGGVTTPLAALTGGVVSRGRGLVGRTRFYRERGNLLRLAAVENLGSRPW